MFFLAFVISLNCIQFYVLHFNRFKLDSEKFRDSHYSEIQSLERALAQERLQLEQQLAKASQSILQLKTDLEKVNIWNLFCSLKLRNCFKLHFFYVSETAAFGCS